MEEKNKPSWYKDEANKISKKQKMCGKLYKLFDALQYIMGVGAAVTVGMFVNTTNYILCSGLLAGFIGLFAGATVSKIKVKDTSREYAKRREIISQIVVDEENRENLIYSKEAEIDKAQEYTINSDEEQNSLEKVKE